MVAQHIFAFSALRMLVAAVMLLAAGALPAAEASPHRFTDVTDAATATYPEVRRLLARDQPAAALKVMQAQLASHENDPDYFHLTGLIALKAKDFRTAQSALERVVLMQPENAGAWMDLAIAATETGQTASATSYFNYIEAEFSPPPALRAVIAVYRSRLVSLPLPPRGFSLQAELFVGTDSNANSGLQNSNIPLTIGTERIELPLDPSTQARRDQFIQLAAGGVYSRKHDGGQLDLSLNVRQRHYFVERDFSTLELSLGGGLRRATGAGDLSFGLQASHLSLGGSPLMYTTVAVAQFERAVQGCRAGLGAELEERRYFKLASFNAQLVWGQAGLGCNWKIASTPLLTTLIGRTGWDSPSGNRAGGRTRHAEVMLQANAPLAWGVTAAMSYTIAKATDAEGYSPLLEQNAARMVDRRSTRLSLSRPLGGGADAVLNLEDTRVLSNLPLFRQSGRTLSIGIKKSF